MPRKRKVTSSNTQTAGVQLALDLVLEDYKKVPYPMDKKDVGGTLVSILSEGLYRDPMHAIREYAQNAIDAEARHVVINMTANSVSIWDDGTGMNLAELVQARQFGISRKLYDQHVGFRGIGIYSGFDVCKRLVIATQKYGEQKRYILEFDFAEMKQQIAKEQMDRALEPTSLLDLISCYSVFSQEPGNPDGHYTAVTMEDIKPFHLQRLYDTEQLRQYILKTLPIDFDDSFQYKAVINQKLRQLPGYHAAQVVLQADGQPDVVVAKPAIPNLCYPEMGYVANSKGENVAFFWACMNQLRGKIDDRYSDYRGFTYKFKGFTIGDNQRLRTMFRGRGNQVLYEWWTGEVYVLDPNVVPTAERSDFQSSQAKLALEVAVEDRLRKLAQEAQKVQAQGRAEDVLTRHQSRVALYDEWVRNGERYDSHEVWADLRTAIDEVKQQRPHLPQSRRSEADELMRLAEKLQKTVHRETEEPTPPEKRRKKVRDRDQDTTKTLPLFPQAPVRPPLFTKSLIQIVEDAGWEIPGELGRVLANIDAAIASALGMGSPAYINLLADIEARLLTENND